MSVTLHRDHTFIQHQEPNSALLSAHRERLDAKHLGPILFSFFFAHPARRLGVCPGSDERSEPRRARLSPPLSNVGALQDLCGSDATSAAQLPIGNKTRQPVDFAGRFFYATRPGPGVCIFHRWDPRQCSSHPGRPISLPSSSLSGNLVRSSASSFSVLLLFMQYGVYLRTIPLDIGLA